MPVIANPFGTGFDLAEMTEGLNILPNQYGRLNDMGLFRDEGVSQLTVVLEERAGTINLLPSQPWGAPATVGNRESRVMRSFAIPHIPHNDVVLPQDVQGVRAFNTASTADAWAQVMARKLTRIRSKHDQTKEYMRVQSLKGILKDGAGNTLYNWFTEFGGSLNTLSFELDSDKTDVGAKCRAVLRYLETNAKGESWTNVRCLVASDFWDSLITHTSVKTAFQYYVNGPEPLRRDLRRGFTFHGITFEEYNATVTLADGSTTEALIDSNCGYIVLEGATDTYVTYYAPMQTLDTVNTIGLPYYARQLTRRENDGYDILTESNPLPLVRRPALLTKITYT